MISEGANSVLSEEIFCSHPLWDDAPSQDSFLSSRDSNNSSEESPINSESLKTIVVGATPLHPPPSRPLIPLPTLENRKSPALIDDHLTISSEDSQSLTQSSQESLLAGTTSTNSSQTDSFDDCEGIITKLRRRSQCSHIKCCSSLFQFSRPQCDPKTCQHCLSKTATYQRLFLLNFQSFRKSIIKLLFERFAGHYKVSDEIIFSAIQLFDYYFSLEALHPYPRSPKKTHVALPTKHEANVSDHAARAKEFAVAAVILVSKLENIRHLSLRTACELAEIKSESAIIRQERRLFLVLNPWLSTPSACHFIKAYLIQYRILSVGSQQLPKEHPYNLAVYILALNVFHTDSARVSAEAYGRACVWISIIILKLRATEKIIEFGALMQDDKTQMLCRHILYRALESCKSADNPVNRYFASSKRHGIRNRLLNLYSTDSATEKVTLTSLMRVLSGSLKTYTVNFSQSNGSDSDHDIAF